MVRGWLRPSQGRPRLPASTENIRRGEYDSWEPLGRLLLPEMHSKVDEILKSRKAAKSQPPPEQPPVPTEEANGRQVHPATNPAQSSAAVDDGVASGRDNEDRQQGPNHEASDPDPDPATASEAGADRHSHSAASRSEPISGNAGDNNNGGTNGGADITTGSSGTHTDLIEEDNRRTAEALSTHNRDQPNRQDVLSPNINRTDLDGGAEPIIAAHYEEPLPIYTRYPEPTWGFSPTNTLHQTSAFCANCDPRAQVSRTSLLSDYLCGACWADFILWRNNEAN